MQQPMKRVQEEISAMFHKILTQKVLLYQVTKVVVNIFFLLHGVASLIDYYSKKILNVHVKSSHCQTCSIRKYSVDPAEFAE